jgi:glycosyltransferase involved in cell wall biosynthesis
MSPRVLFVDHTAQLGGAELSMLEIAKALSASSRVVLFEDGPFRHRLEAASVPTTVLPAPGQLNDVRRNGSVLAALRSIPGLIQQAARLTRVARGYDVLVANSQKSMLVGALAGWLARRPVIWHCRDLMSADHFGALQRTVAGWVARWWVDHVIANSHATKNALVAIGGHPDQITVVHNGIDAAPFDAVTSQDVDTVRDELSLPETGVVGVFSRLAEWKGQHILLEALRDLPDVTALIVGDALFPEDRAYADRLRRTIQDNGLGSRVRMTGFREDVPVLMHACDVIVHTSTAPEPFGRVIVEGMLAGRPVVATNIGGPSEIIADRETGILVPPNNPSELRFVLRRVATNTDYCKQLARKGYQYASETYTVAPIVNDMITIICQHAPERDGAIKP